MGSIAFFSSGSHDEVPFVQLCRDCLIRQFGIKTLAVKQLRQLFACIATEESRARHARLGSFARLVGVAEPEGSRVQCALAVPDGREPGALLASHSLTSSPGCTAP